MRSLHRSMPMRKRGGRMAMKVHAGLRKDRKRSSAERKPQVGRLSQANQDARPADLTTVGSRPPFSHLDDDLDAHDLDVVGYLGKAGQVQLAVGDVDDGVVVLDVEVVML
jgi:hypothetical protein